MEGSRNGDYQLWSDAGQIIESPRLAPSDNQVN
jgi:hypothetical protein